MRRLGRGGERKINEREKKGHLVSPCQWVNGNDKWERSQWVRPREKCCLCNNRLNTSFHFHSRVISSLDAPMRPTYSAFLFNLPMLRYCVRARDIFLSFTPLPHSVCFFTFACCVNIVGMGVTTGVVTRKREGWNISYVNIPLFTQMSFVECIMWLCHATREVLSSYAWGFTRHLISIMNFTLNLKFDLPNKNKIMKYIRNIFRKIIKFAIEQEKSKRNKSFNFSPSRSEQVQCHFRNWKMNKNDRHWERRERKMPRVLHDDMLLQAREHTCIYKA